MDTWRSRSFFCSTIMASTADAWAMLDRAIIGHSMVPPNCWDSVVSMALVMWCRPVMTSGAYSRPKMGAKTQRRLPVRPA